MLCELGCGNESKFYSKWSKIHICSDHVNKCPSRRQGRPQSEMTKQKLSQIAKNKGYGGYKEGSGRGKRGWYQGYYCASSWELAYIVFCLDHGIGVVRNQDKRQYTWNGVIMNYVPDFIVEGRFVEIKGYNSPQWLAKREANPDVEVLGSREMKPILEYVVKKYGKNFINLYKDSSVQGAQTDLKSVAAE